MEEIKVMLVEDNPAWVDSMVEFINRNDGMKIITVANSREEAVEKAMAHEPDVILMDINLTGNNLDGIHAAIEILQFSRAKVIMLTCLDDEKTITDSFTAGAVEYIPKTDYMLLPEAIRRSANKKSPIEVLMNDYIRLRREEQLKNLTPAEKEVYGLIEKGYSRADIEKELFKTENTIKKQISSILKKLEVATIKQAINLVKYMGLYKEK